MPGLTKETFLAVKQTCRAITGLAKYLINFCGFKYVLLGKIQSDTIEGRFGHIRQLSGANYYISMRQLFESDRKLRTLSLLKYSRISVNQIEETVKSGEKTDDAVVVKAESLYGDLMFNIKPTDNDFGIIYYVTGYCCKSLVRSNKCERCKEVTTATVSDSDNEIPDTANNFFKDINRGGLWKPTAEAFKIGCLCWNVFAELSSEKLRQDFLSATNQRGVFVNIVLMAFYEQAIVPPWSVAVVCEKGHNILEGISSRYFNCMCKNLIRQINSLQISKEVRKLRKFS